MLRGFQLKNIQEVILEMYIRSRMPFPKIAVFHRKKKKNPHGFPGKVLSVLEKKKVPNRGLTRNWHMFSFRL